MKTDKLIDLTYLEGLSKGSDGFVKKMLLLFLDQTPVALSNLEKYLNNKDWKALQATAHKFKAAFMFLGVEDLPDQILTVEEYAAGEIHLELLPELIAQITDMSNTVMKELEIEIKDKY